MQPPLAVGYFDSLGNLLSVKVMGIYPYGVENLFSIVYLTPKFVIRVEDRSDIFFRTVYQDRTYMS